MLKVGIAGARGICNIVGFKAYADEVQVFAICDLNEDVAKKAANEYGIPNYYRVYNDMLESDIDAVVISTPMHLHVPQAIAALEAGKHVLCEVTAGVTMDELWWLIEAVEESGKVYMFAENCCFLRENLVINEMVKAGLFGKTYFGEGEYLHEIKGMAAYHDGKTSWRKYWQLGKRGAFYPTHSIGPVLKWFGEDRIQSVICASSGQNIAKEFGLRQDDTTITLCQTRGGALIKLRVDCMSPRPHNNLYYTLQGTKGCYEAPRGLGDDHKVWLESMGGDTNNPQWQPLESFHNEFLPKRYQNVTEEQKQSGHWGSDFYIVGHFLDAVIRGEKPYIDVYDACEWTAVALLSELSVTNNGRLMEMPDFRKYLNLEDQITKL
jgi:predicted dehydrogenase